MENFHGNYRSGRATRYNEIRKYTSRNIFFLFMKSAMNILMPVMAW